VGDPPVGRQLVEARERLGGGSVAGVLRVPREQAVRYGVIEGEPVDGRTWRVRSIVEKPPPDRIPSELAAVHAYVFEPEIFDHLEGLAPGRGGEIWLTDAVNALAARQPVHAYLFEGERFDAGDRLGYLQAVFAAALRRPEVGDALRSWLQGRLDGRPSV
jgi:UTP--glucose-1-phosphate uridylyltransferase